MSFLGRIFILYILIASISISNAATIYFLNGDRLTGHILERNSGYIKLDILNLKTTINIDERLVERVEGGSKLSNLENTENSTTELKDAAELEKDSPIVNAPTAQEIYENTWPHIFVTSWLKSARKIWPLRNWESSINFDLSTLKGHNDENKYKYAFNSRKETASTEHIISFSYTLEDEVNDDGKREVEEDKLFAEYRLRYELDEYNLIAEAHSELEQDKIEPLERDIQQKIGVGYQYYPFKNNELLKNLKLSLIPYGIAFRNQKFENKENNEWNVNYYLTQDIEWPINQSTTFRQEFSLQTADWDLQNADYDISFSLDHDLTQYIFIRFGYSYDSNYIKDDSPTNSEQHEFISHLGVKF